MVPNPADDREGREAGEDSAPLGDLADRIRTRRDEAAAGNLDTSPDIVEGSRLEEFFQESPVDGVPAGDLWSNDDTPQPYDSGVDAAGAADEHKVSKRAYCENCQYLSEPPEISCTHPGTTIVEFMDIDHVRVRNCPVVAERQSLGEDDVRPMTPSTFGDG